MNAFTINRHTSTLLIIDFQQRLMPAIDQGENAVTNTRRLLKSAALLGVPALFTEQNPNGLGPTLTELTPDPSQVLHKMTFDASRATGFFKRLAPDHALIVCGCEAHVCVLQTVLGLLGSDREVFVVRDAIGSRRAENKEAGIQRMAHCGAKIVTTEMVIFEWLESAEHPLFRSTIALIK